MGEMEADARLAILRMIEGGQVSAEQAVDLLDALESGDAEETTLPGGTVEEEAWMLTALLQVTEAISGPLPNQDSLDEMLARVARIVPLLAGVDRCVLWLWDEWRKMYPVARYPVVETGGGDGIDRELLEQVRSCGEPLHVVGVSGANALLPMTTLGKIAGVMQVEYMGARRFSDKEMAILSNIAAQAAVGVENLRLRQAAVERARLEKELQLARDVQISLLPGAAPAMPGWDIAGYWQAAHSVGGDFYDFVPLSNHRLGIVIADVSDKGMPAALFMALSRTIIRASVTRSGAARGLQRANRLICADARNGMFVTVLYGILDVDGLLVYANAGHNPPLLVAADEALSLQGRGTALGILDRVDLQEHTVAAHSGDVLVLYTDGLTEATNDDDEQFGVDRLLDVVRENRQLTAAAVIEQVMKGIRAFAGARPITDDATILVAKRV
jgi:phosphoserine phosphatase RsbU/P